MQQSAGNNRCVHGWTRWAIAAVAALAISGAHAATYYVDVNYNGANGTPNGTSTRPYTNLLAAAAVFIVTPFNHTVLVAGGDYKSISEGGIENFGTTGYNLDRRPGTWKGGYVGQVSGATFDWNDATRTLPDAAAISTATMAVINLTNAYSRAFTTGTTVADHILVFDGFVFRDSYVTQAAYVGGALHVNGNMSASTLRNCVFLNNRTTGNGGGAWFGGRWSTSTKLVFRGNTSSGGMGGGLFVQAGNTGQDFTDCEFEANTAVSGGGMATGDTQAFNLTRCRFAGNTASSFGGAVGLGKKSGITGRQCRFTGNSANRGSAVGNTDTYSGVGISLENSLVAGNTATGAGYALYASGGADNASVINLRHTTVVNNTLGGVYFYYGRKDERPVFQLDNTVIVSNGTPGVYCSFPTGTLTQYGDALGRPRINYSLVFGHTADITWAGEAGTTRVIDNLLSVDPEFADVGTGDYRLALGSPCVDTAKNLAVTVDLDGVSRPTRHGYDRGCYEEWQIPIIASRAAIAQPTAAEVRAEFTYESASITTYAYLAIDTTDKGTNSLAAWWQSASAGAQPQGVIFGTSFSGLSPNTTYWYRCMASNSYDVMWGPAASFKTPAAGGATRVWTGFGGNALASTAGNWLGGVAPSAGDYIVLDGSPSNLTWNAAAPKAVGSWTQTEKYTGTVTFEMTYPSYSTAFTNVTVAGDAIVAAGAWTHLGPQNHADQRYRLSVTVGGSFTLGTTGRITAQGKGYNNGQGPGVGNYDKSRGASHGGQGGSGEGAPRGVTYGSIRAPVTLGSGGVTGGPNNGHGGGSIEIDVASAATVNGPIDADAYAATDWRAGAGGSVWLRAGSLSGIGTIRANGYPAGGGGRVAIKLTGAAAVAGVTVQALGGIQADRTGAGAAGTVYIETTAHAAGAGILRLDNDNRCGTVIGSHPYMYNCSTRMPSAGNGGPVDLSSFAEVIIANKAMLGLASDTVWNPATTSLTVAGRDASYVSLADATHSVVWPATYSVNGFTLVLNTPLTVSGNWTVAADGRISRFRARNAAYSTSERLVLNLTGNLTIATGGEIQVDAQGYANGAGTAVGAWDPGRGGGHGGQGGFTAAAPGLTYGSVLEPVTWGSGGSSGGNNTAEGGGALELRVSGTLTVNGALRAAAFANGNNGGAGGSILVAAGELAGSGGVIQARGYNSGAGGHVAVKLASGSAFPAGVAIDARGGTINGWEGSSGTVYTERAGEANGNGTILVENGQWTGMRTYGVQLPPSTGTFSDNLTNTVLRLQSRARVVLRSNLQVRDLEVSANSYLVTGAYKLYVKALEHNLDNPAVKGKGSTTMVDTYANIVWIGSQPGTVLLLR